MANIELRVTPEKLERKADVFSGIVKEIKAHFDTAEDISARTKNYWQGEAGTRDRESYASYKDDIAFIIRRLEEHPTDLLAMAGIYRDTEREITAKNAQLKTDQIV